MLKFQSILYYVTYTRKYQRSKLNLMSIRNFWSVLILIWVQPKSHIRTSMGWPRHHQMQNLASKDVGGCAITWKQEVDPSKHNIYKHRRQMTGNYKCLISEWEIRDPCILVRRLNIQNSWNHIPSTGDFNLVESKNE